MRFLVDNQLPVTLAVWLRKRGHDAVHVQERGDGQVDDRLLWELALGEERIVITKDEDFHLGDETQGCRSVALASFGQLPDQSLARVVELCLARN